MYDTEERDLEEQRDRGSRKGLLISGGIVVTMDRERRIFQRGAILIRRGYD